MTAKQPHKPLVAGLVVGAAALALGPVVGALGTGLGLLHSFGAVGETAASKKAELLSTGIDDAMHWATVGTAVGAAGAVLAALCGFLLWRATRTATSSSSNA
jgi:biopolymer transport protein ExbB/TolQ